MEQDIREDKGKREKEGSDPDYSTHVKSLVIVFSFHHGNTAKIANACAKVLGAAVIMPQQVTPEELEKYDLVGFGSGIYGGTFHKSLLDLADSLPLMNDRKAFLFSTFGAPSIVASREFVEKNHRQMREKLEEKGYTAIGEFSCEGWNTNSFLKYFGGINKGRPDTRDIRNTEEFARNMGEFACRGTSPRPGEISWFPRK